MFYDTFVQLCGLKGVSRSKALLDAGVPKSALTYWKSEISQGNDPKPSNQTAVKLASYFNVSIDYLLTGEKETSNTINSGALTQHEAELIAMYRALDAKEQHLLEVQIDALIADKKKELNG